MPFTPGHKLSPGRPKGSLNKRTVEFYEVLEKENFNPALALIECYREAKKVYDNYGLIYDAIVDAKEEQARENGYSNIPPEDNSHKYLKIAADIAKELASYSYPKLKAIEQQKEDPLSGMTPAQKLEAMKQAVKALEMDLKRNEPEPSQ